MFMTYGALDQNGEGSEAECCSRPTPTPYFIARSSAALVRQVQCVRASSLSISGGGIRVGSTGRCHRSYRADDAQASAEHDRTAAEIRAEQWLTIGAIVTLALNSFLRALKRHG